MIIFTGGGSGGHSMVAMTLINYFRKQNNNLKISYIGSHKGIERKLCEDNSIPFYPISTGKLRRYLSLENVKDVFKFFWGLVQSVGLLLGNLKEAEVVFSTGGFVSVAPSLAAWMMGKRVYLHEQTTRVGLANKIISKFATKVFISFESSSDFFPEKKTILSGYPLRDEVYEVEKKQRVELGLVEKPLLFITGGGNGSMLINELIDENKEKLLENFRIIHQVGEKFISSYKSQESPEYQVHGFIRSGMIQILKDADVIISRAGAGTVSELIALDKSVLFIPLKIAQRNEQFFNAKEALKFINSKIIEEDELEQVSLPIEVEELLDSQENVVRMRRKRSELPQGMIYKEIYP